MTGTFARLVVRKEIQQADRNGFMVVRNLGVHSFKLLVALRHLVAIVGIQVCGRVRGSLQRVQARAEASGQLLLLGSGAARVMQSRQAAEELLEAAHGQRSAHQQVAERNAVNALHGDRVRLSRNDVIKARDGWEEVGNIVRHAREEVDLAEDGIGSARLDDDVIDDLHRTENENKLISSYEGALRPT